MTDDSAMEEGRLEEIDKDEAVETAECIQRDNQFLARLKLGEVLIRWDTREERPEIGGLLAAFALRESKDLHAENDALKQQLQALREQDHMCRELVQEIADSKICWSDWAGDYIQWTEDITRKARKVLGLKDE